MADDRLTAIVKTETPRVRARLIRELRDFDLAEDSLQEALLRAVKSWPVDGIPKAPAAWLTTVAKRCAIDVMRRKQVHDRAVGLLLPGEEGRDELDVFNDDLMRLIFTCCHPSLNLEAQIALTLRTVVDMSLAQVARAFLVSEKTMDQRLVRAKRKIKQAGIPYTVPGSRDLPRRLQGVLTVFYLVFNEGYSATAGDALIRFELCQIAIQMTRQLNRLVRGRAEALSLLSLMLLQHSRSKARVDAAGRLVLLEDQDRGLWDRRAITEGTMLLEKALLARQPPGPFQLQAAIAAVHANAVSPEATDWQEIRALYDGLLKFQDMPVVRLNRAVAIGMAEGADAGLQVLELMKTSQALMRHHLFHSAKAGLLLRSGRNDAACESYRAALALAQNGTERDFLVQRIEALEAGGVQ
ncbi:MAG: sigma-70 family RNA polymerase sigma factor [Gammaproteobacteria bacterium]|nr:sigma-70 family RNA polymerase sigma factor [Gammaproteobacteria bacterium]